MALSKPETQQLLERLIFEDTASEDWVQDVWSLSPLLGDSAAKLLEAFQAVCDRCSDEDLEDLLQTLYQEQME
ncbi:MAG: hypothetical protein NW224_25270 [Leptolyngbyaceae cyanobacterium bins.302]|nr:hypothetical protein [Leptolyngbyaceae cyanobacterium bins.302]